MRCFFPPQNTYTEARSLGRTEAGEAMALVAAEDTASLATPLPPVRPGPARRPSSGPALPLN